MEEEPNKAKSETREFLGNKLRFVFFPLWQRLLIAFYWAGKHMPACQLPHSHPCPCVFIKIPGQSQGLTQGQHLPSLSPCPSVRSLAPSWTLLGFSSCPGETASHTHTTSEKLRIVSARLLAPHAQRSHLPTSHNRVKRPAPAT